MSAGAAAPARRVLVVLVPGLRAADLSRPKLPVLDQLALVGTSGWMVCRAARVAGGKETTASRLLTLDCGARAVAEPDLLTQVAFEAASAGAHPPPAFLTLQRQNAQLDHPVPLGALGDGVHQIGGKTAVIGDFDTDRPDRSAFAVAMDSAGTVDFVAPLAAKRDANAPYGFRADVPGMLKQTERAAGQAALIVLAFGDLERADRYAPLCLPAAAEEQRAAALRSLETLLSGLSARFTERPGTLLCILAPGPAETPTDPTDRLAPIILWSKEVTSGSVLTSASTRRAGLVLNTDFLPTVGAFLGFRLPPGATGRPMTEERATVGLPAALLRLQAEHTAFLQNARKQDALGGWPTVQMLLVLAGLVLIARGKSPRLLGAIAVAVVALPLGMLLLPPLSSGSVLGAGLLLTAFTAMLAVWAWRHGAEKEGAQPLFYGLCLTLASALLADLLTGSHLLRQAWMSYSVMEAARFYGIGNEYMGAAIGTACVLFACSYFLFPQREAGRKGMLVGRIALCTALLAVMGAPAFGAKVGAVPSAGAAFGAMLLVYRRGRLRAREVVFIVVGIGLLLLLFVMLDAHRAAGEQTHLARAFAGAGGGTLLGIARRKLLLEASLLVRSPWSAACGVCVVGLVWLRRKAPSLFAPSEPTKNTVRAAWTGLIAGAVASLLCNDSGVTAAALILLIGWAWTAVRLAAPPS